MWQLSLFKFWLRELEESLIPTALYNDALIASKDYAQVVEIVQNSPVYNRRVLVFVVGFVQMFMQEKTCLHMYIYNTVALSDTILHTGFARGNIIQRPLYRS